MKFSVAISASLLAVGTLTIEAPAPAKAGDGVAAGIAAGALAGVAAGAILSAPRATAYYGPAPAYYPPPAYYGPPCFYEDRQVWDPYRGYVIVRERVC